MWEYNNTNELYHYGILGMRWGRRRARKVAKIEKNRKQSISDTQKSRYGRTSYDLIGRGAVKSTVGSAMTAVGSKLMLKGKAKTGAALSVIGAGYALSGLVETGKGVVSMFTNKQITVKNKK